MSTLKVNSAQIGQSLTATNNFTLYQPSTPDGTVRLGVGNAGATTLDTITVNSSGNVGIGTSSPSYKLDVTGISTITSRIGTTSAGAAGAGLIFQGSATSYKNWLIGSSYSATSGGLEFIPSTANGGTTFTTPAMILDSSGNLGLGVTPSGWYSTLKALQVGGTASVSHLNAGAGNQQANFGNNFYYNSSGVETYIQSTGAQRYRQLSGAGHVWEIAPSGTAGNAISFTQAMTLDASGNLLVGTTSVLNAAKLSISYDHSTSIGLTILSSSTTTSTQVRFTNPNGVVGRIDTSGTTTAYVTSSDQRLKTNVEPAGSAIQSILDFPVDQFDWIVDGQHQDFGAIAQKVQPIIPEMVSVPADEDEMWGIDWSKAVPRLIKTMQEMHQEIQTLKAKVNA